MIDNSNSDSTTELDEPVEWDDKREQAEIHGRKEAIPEETQRQAERRREGL